MQEYLKNLRKVALVLRGKKPTSSYKCLWLISAQIEKNKHRTTSVPAQSVGIMSLSKYRMAASCHFKLPILIYQTSRYFIGTCCHKIFTARSYAVYFPTSDFTQYTIQKLWMLYLCSYISTSLKSSFHSGCVNSYVNWMENYCSSHWTLVLEVLHPVQLIVPKIVQSLLRHRN